MNIIVCVKQVKNFRMNAETGLDPRYKKSNELFNNPSDLAALSWALKLKEQYGFTVATISMGPLSTKALVRELFSYGVDRTLLLTSPSLYGSDTYATSYAIGKLITALFPKYNLIICGDKSLDGDTGQVPHALATELDINSFANVSNISYQNEKIEMVCEIDSTWVKFMSEDKALVTVSQGPGGYTYLPGIKNILGSKSKNVEIITCDNVSISEERVGNSGSLTKVISLHNKLADYKRTTSKIHFGEEQEKLDELMRVIVGDKL